MGAKVMIVGVGDLGSRFAEGLAASGKVGDLVLAGLCQGRGPEIAGVIASCHPCRVRFVALDATRQGDVESLLRGERPDLLVQSGSLLSPWFAIGRSDPAARAIAAAGLGVQLPAQLPILMSVMRAVRSVDFRGPVANVSFPDVTHPILARLDLAPTIGLGNVSMMHLRVGAALRERAAREGGELAEPPLIRVIGHHKQVYGVLKAEAPADRKAWVRVYLGDDGERADDLAYVGFPLAPGIRYNAVTSASALPILLALLPGAEPLRFSAPAPLGLAGGYPVRIERGRVDLDLPGGVDLDETADYFRRIARGDGVENIAGDGTVTFTDAAQQGLRDIAPELAEPLAPDAARTRFDRLMAAFNA